MKARTWLIRAAFPLAAVVPAAAYPDSQFYAGAGYGAYRFKENSLKQDDSLWKAYAGSSINSTFGVELSFVDFARATSQGSTFDADGYGAALVLQLPFPIVTAYAKGGVYFWDAESNFAGVSASDSGDDPFYGAGVKFSLAPHVALRVEYERYKISDVKLDTANAAVQVNF